MFSNYLKIALRTLNRRKGYTFINLFGLAVGIASCILIFMYVQDEFSYDNHFSKSDRIYRVYRQQNTSGSGTTTFAQSNYALAPLLEDNYSQIEKAVRFGRVRTAVSYEDQAFTESNFLFADAGMLDLFDIRLLKGNEETALSAPNSVILTPATARKYFGNEDPIGKTLIIREEYPVVVTGIAQEMPSNTHFHFDFIASIETTRNWYSESMFEHWGNMWLYTYVQIANGTSATDLDAQFPEFIRTFAPEGAQQFKVEIHLQNIKDIHLYSGYSGELEAGGNALLVYVFMIVAIIILAIASFNFINLSTARSAWRAKEVGIRKVAGAYRSSLIGQFIGESLLITLLAVAIALISIELFLPVFNTFTGKELALGLGSNIALWSIVFGVLCVVGIASGSYPAFYLSSFQPVTVLKGRKSSGDHKKAALLRKGLVVFQFGISTALIIGTLVIYQQLDFLKNYDLGYDKEQVLITQVNRLSVDQAQLLKDGFLEHSNVVYVCTNCEWNKRHRS